MAHPQKCDAGISAAPTRDAPTGITVQDYRPFFAPLKGASPQKSDYLLVILYYKSLYQ